MFGKDKNENSNEKVLYEGQPNIIVYSKGILFAMILLGVLFFLYTTGIQYIGNMQVYMIESSKLPLTRYFAIALFIIMIVVIAYMVIKILKWTSIHYTITESRVTVEEGLIFNKKNSMPFNTIQDVGRSQNIFGKLFSVGSITLYSAYDGKDLELKDLSNPKKVENLIFENMRGTHLRSRNLYDDGYDSGYVNGPNSGYNNRPYNPNNNYDAYGAAYAGAAYSSKDPDEKQHYRRMEDLDDLELVDVKERKRNLREIRRKARDSRNNNYNNPNAQPYDSGRGYNQNQQYGNGNYNQDPNYDSNYNQDYDRDYNPNYNSGSRGYNQRQGNQEYNPNYRSNRQSNYSPNVNPRYDSSDDSNAQRNYNDRPGRDNRYGAPQDNRRDSRFDAPRDSRRDNRFDAPQAGSIGDYGPRDSGRDYENQNHGPIRESYQKNPNKYFAKNYEKFHQDNLNMANSGSSRPYESRDNDFISDEEFDSTINQAMQNIDDNIKFKQSANENNFNQRPGVNRDSSYQDTRNRGSAYQDTRSRDSSYQDTRNRDSGMNRNPNYSDRVREPAYSDNRANRNQNYDSNRGSRYFDYDNRRYDDSYYPNSEFNHRPDSYNDYDNRDYRQNQPPRLEKQAPRDNYNPNHRKSNRNYRSNRNYNNKNNYNNPKGSNDYYNDSYNQKDTGYEEPKENKSKKSKNRDNDLLEKHSRKFRRS